MTLLSCTVEQMAVYNDYAFIGQIGNRNVLSAYSFSIPGNRTVYSARLYGFICASYNVIIFCTFFILMKKSLMDKDRSMKCIISLICYRYQQSNSFTQLYGFIFARYDVIVFCHF